MPYQVFGRQCGCFVRSKLDKMICHSRCHKSVTIPVMPSENLRNRLCLTSWRLVCQYPDFWKSMHERNSMIPYALVYQCIKNNYLHLYISSDAVVGQKIYRKNWHRASILWPCYHRVLNPRLLVQDAILLSLCHLCVVNNVFLLSRTRPISRIWLSRFQRCVTNNILLFCLMSSSICCCWVWSLQPCSLMARQLGTGQLFCEHCLAWFWRTTKIFLWREFVLIWWPLWLRIDVMFWCL